MMAQSIGMLIGASVPSFQVTRRNTHRLTAVPGVRRWRRLYRRSSSCEDRAKTVPMPKPDS